MAKNVVELGLHLSLTGDENEENSIPSNVWNQHENKQGTALLVIGRLLSHKSNNFDALKTTLTVLLHPVKGMTMWRISEERFCIRFNHRLDKQRALEGRPWTFDKNLLILEPLMNRETPDSVNLDWCPFTVHVHNLPLLQHTRNMAEFIGNKIGRFLDYEIREHDSNWSSDMRLKFAMDITKPLKRALRLITPQWEDLLVTFTYDRLPNFCYLCGLLGHIAKFCRLRYEEDFVDLGDSYPYGSWLHTNNPVRFSN
ncbi:UNVERIFIED_CONTAM: hypothetical protein Sradi_4009900 [Sesamum radiatum]|uniref:CCHC-type domain-containing protein n=1 Tax=Sesamum radiatum TaxID=300843 RepID=A0AAW2PKA1_SESRA